MAEWRLDAQRDFDMPGDQALIGLVFAHNGQDVTRYFAEEADADAAVEDIATEQALALIGAWNDLDWDEMAATLDRIRHESPPSAPLEV